MIPGLLLQSQQNEVFLAVPLLPSSLQWISLAMGPQTEQSGRIPLPLP